MQRLHYVFFAAMFTMSSLLLNYVVLGGAENRLDLILIARYLPAFDGKGNLVVNGERSGECQGIVDCSYMICTLNASYSAEVLSNDCSTSEIPMLKRGDLLEVRQHLDTMYILCHVVSAIGAVIMLVLFVLVRCFPADAVSAKAYIVIVAIAIVTESMSKSYIVFILDTLLSHQEHLPAYVYDDQRHSAHTAIATTFVYGILSGVVLIVVTLKLSRERLKMIKRFDRESDGLSFSKHSRKSRVETEDTG